MNGRELRGTEWYCVVLMKQPSKGGWRRALDSAGTSFVTERELLGMWETYIPRTIFVACGQPKDLWNRLVSCFTCCKTRNGHYFVHRALVTVNTKRNYGVHSWRHERVLDCRKRSSCRRGLPLENRHSQVCSMPINLQHHAHHVPLRQTLCLCEPAPRSTAPCYSSSSHVRLPFCFFLLMRSIRSLMQSINLHFALSVRCGHNPFPPHA